MVGGNSIEEAAKIFMALLNNKGTSAQNNAVVANAAFAIQTMVGGTILDAIEAAKESLCSGKANSIFKSLIQNK